MNRIDIREDRLRYGIATLINRANFLYLKLFINEVGLTENSARIYLNQMAEYRAICELLNTMGIYNWIQADEYELKMDSSDIEIIK